ncbi:MAG: cytochrome c oxidase subunit 2 [Candidatus Binatia bacterium]|nr:MAG: cytochrome c oxidase subunit 2 [Candidatus Binatia bacterium]
MASNFALFPERASTVAGEVDALYLFLVAVSGFFAVLIAALVVVFAIKYRRRAEDERPQAIHGSLALELAWTIIPFGLAMVMFFWGAKVYITLAVPPPNAMEVFVVGKQWMWKLQHLEGKREINELHVPVGQPIKLTMTSEDVIHSFYVPAFRIKQDAIPGRYTTAWFEPTKVGTYHLFCAEYCGTEHAKMIGRIVVMEPAEYQAWLAGTATTAVAAVPAAKPEDQQAAMAAAGAELFQKLGCVSCHRAQAGALGPSLAGLFGHNVALQDGSTVVADEDYIRESILNPQAKIVAGYQPIMPTFKGLVNEEQLMQLIAYIKTGKAGTETQ